MVQVGPQKRPEWEVRHGSLLGLKYLVAVRQVPLFLHAFPCVVFYGSSCALCLLIYIASPRSGVYRFMVALVYR